MIYWFSCPTIIDQIVYGESAIIGDAHEYRGSIYADHFGMTKFSSMEDSGYKKVVYAIEMLMKGKVTPDEQSMCNHTFLFIEY